MTQKKFLAFFQFKTIAKEITDAFAAELEHRHGKLFYNDQIKHKIFDYIDDYYQSREDSTSHYGPDWADKDAIINTDRPENNDVFDCQIDY